MQNFITALKAEHIKKKGTGLYLVSFIIGAIAPLLLAIIALFDDSKRDARIPYNYFTAFLESGLDAFASFFFPLLIIINVSRITQLDHKNGGWQLMETQPLRKLNIYFSKFTVLLVANFIAILSFVALSFLFSWIISFIIDVPKAAVFDFPSADTLLTILRLFVAALFLTALQYLLSVLISSFIWSILIGFGLLLAYLFLLAFRVVPDWYPIEILGKIAQHKKGSQLGYWLTYSEAVSILCTVITLYVGYKWYRHKKLGRAFFGNMMRGLKLAAILAVFGGLLVYALIPNQMPDYDKTVVSGTLTGKDKFRTLYIRDIFINDTIAVVPIKGDHFHYVINKNVPLDTYEFIFDSAIRQQIIMGSKDSIYLDIKSYGNAGEIMVTGTRLAENQYNEKLGTWSLVSYYLEDNMFIDEPKRFAKQLVSDWEDAMGESDKFKTIDNYIPKDDFADKNKKIVTLSYLNYWREYLKKRAAMYPGQETEEIAGIKAMKNMVALNDESLLSNEDYFNYVKSDMIAKNKQDIDEDTKSLRAIAKMAPGSFRDKMLYWQLKKSIEEASAKEDRDKLVAQYAYTFKNPKYSEVTLNNYRIIENLSKGRPAPLFDAVTVDNKPFNLADLKGKFVVIDVWATWCGPCRIQSPYFEKFAIKYKDHNIQFVAASTDQRIDQWFVDAKTKSKSVLQVHINDREKFGKEYDVQGIPRFILIAPDGTLVNVKMPYPEDPMFEKVLREALQLPEAK